MTGEGAVLALSRCYGCRVLFSFDPDTVPSVLTDPRTRLPADHPDADPTTSPGERVAEPLCPACVDRINQDRRKRGLPPAWAAPHLPPEHRRDR